MFIPSGNYDLFTDTHGCGGLLEKLLIKSNYKKNAEGVYFHTNRKAVFIGDYIDRGLEHRRNIEIIKSMVECGFAYASLGNHEYNSICYHEFCEQKQDYLRRHSEGNTKQHQAFLDAYPDITERKEIVNWFKTLPLFIESDDFRVVHACWDQHYIDRVRELLEEGVMDKSFIYKSAINGTTECDIVERLLKGPESHLPDGVSFKDAYGKVRVIGRLKWWKAEKQTLRGILMENITCDNEALDSIIDLNDYNLRPYCLTEKPVFFGHYWFKGEVSPVQENMYCLDYSAVKQGSLVSYRWNLTDSKIIPEQYIKVSSQD